MGAAGIHGVSSTTPENIQFGAGTIHKGLVYSTSWNFDASIVGATSGGSTLTITPEVTPIEVDGANVKLKGMDVKTGETATMEINFAELNADIIKAATLGEEGTSSDVTYDLIESKSDIVAGDYWSNIAFVGRRLDGKKIIAILENALCTSGFSLNPQNKTGSVATVTFECTADPEALTGSLDKLPWKIYYPAE